MKVFFDTNVYIAEALLGRAAARIIKATERAGWRIFASQYVLDEVAHVLVDDLNFSSKLAQLAQRRIARRSVLNDPATRVRVPHDPKDSPILQSALDSGTDYLVTNDHHLLDLNPFRGLRIISMDAYHQLLQNQGILRKK
jgi:putative PIN family toxin of toxin-antitoxin system